MKPPARREPNPYDSPAEIEPRPAARRSIRNRASLTAFVLTMVPPIALLLSPSALVVYPSPAAFLQAVRVLLFLSSPAAIFAVAFSIIGLYGRPNRYSLISLLLGGAECFLIVVFLLLTV